MTTVRGVSWELSLAPFWETQSDKECETIFRPNGLGALQISAARKESDVTDGDLVHFASDHLKAGAEAAPVSLGDFSGITIRYKTDGSHWRQWFLRHGSVALFITYNCSEEDDGVEDAQIDSMLATLTARQKAL